MARYRRGENTGDGGRIQRRLPEDLQAQQPANLFDMDSTNGETSWEDNPEFWQNWGPQGPQATKPGKAGKAKFKREKPPKPKRKKRILLRIILSLVALAVLCILALGVYLGLSTRNDDLWLNLDNVAYYRTETILYTTDAQTGEVSEYARLSLPHTKYYVEPHEIPQNLKNAFVAIEDKNFHSHNGVDIPRTIYAGFNEVAYRLTGSYLGGGRRQGASTIVQQLVKNLTGEDQSNGVAGYMRKAKEIYRAFKMDSEYDKDTILAAYLNTIPFTQDTPGVGAEAQKLFGKHVSELTLPECASLAAIVRNPSRFNPVKNPDDHLTRRNYVLGEMLDEGYITQEEHDLAVNTQLELAEQTIFEYEEPITDYFTDTVIEDAIAELMDQRGLSRNEAWNLLYKGGLRIYTTVVPGLQTAMETAMMGSQYFNAGGAQAAMVSLTYDGGVAAIVGGTGEKDISRGFNRATSAVRQIGSTAKGIGPYVVALEKNKITWSSAFYDGPVKQVEDEATGEKVDWPSNVTNYYTERDILVVNAFAESVNTIAVRVGETTGWRSIYNFLRKDVGITTLVRDDIDAAPLALGANTHGISPIEMAMAYSMFGNGGYVYNTHSFTRIENGIGEILLEVDVSGKQAISSDTAMIVNRLMEKVMVGAGTASGKKVGGVMDSVGKTGTTSDHRDNWFVGLTPYYVTAVWYGYDDNAQLYVNNAQNPTILSWKWVMEQGQAGLPEKSFPHDSTVAEAAYCTTSGYAAGANCPSATGYYRSGRLPESGCPVHG